MSNFFKNKKSMILAMSALLLVITVVAGSLAILLGDGSLSLSVGGTVRGEAESDDLSENLEEIPPIVDTAEVPVDEGPVQYNVPGQMRGVFLTPGVDFVVDATTESAQRAEIDAALQNASDLTMNTIIIVTSYEDRVIYQTQDAPAISESFDIMQYVVEKSRALNLYTYAIFDASLYQQSSSPAVKLAVGSGTLDKLGTNLREFSQKYPLDAILIDGYQNAEEVGSYISYLSVGGAIGYNNYMRQSPEAVVQTAANTIRTWSRNTQVGLLADAVWANAEEHEEGSNTTAGFTALGTAHADTREYVQTELVDFVAVKAYASLTDNREPFGEVVAWWSEIARDSSIPLYMVHAASKACTEEEGWQSHDQLTRQIIEAEGYSGYRGSIFNDLSRLVEDPKDTTTTLIKYFNEEVEAAHILTELEITKPDQTTFTTFEPVVTFTGASDPNSDVTINGEVIPTDASGYFTVTIDLDAGLNSFTIEHKEKTIQYAITRQVQILKDMSPTGSITTDGGMTITITATAYSDAAVYATINGSTVPMEIGEEEIEDEADRDSNYKMFVGEYTAPAATSEEQSLGSIVVYGSWEGHSDTMTGAAVKVNKKAVVENGAPVVVSAAQARTYPANTLTNVPNANYFPLPQGAMDYAVGDEIVYKKGNTTYTYYVLASGLRVSSGDIKAVSDGPGSNVISGMTVSADSRYTYVTLKMTQQVAYTLQYTNAGVSVTFHYTNSVPGGLSLNQNPLFDRASWNDTTLNLNFIKAGAFHGYRGYFDETGNLVLRFKNPPGSLSGARIAIDPGHGGNDPGAPGFLAAYPEKVINLAIAKELAKELESRGATVLLLDTSNNPSLPARVAAAENWNADIFLSIHNNTASNSAAAGTEVYYYNSYSYPLALNIASNTSSQLATNNRGARKSYYNVTLSAQFPSVLVECGFLTNKNEYEKLLNSRYQQRIAVGIADGISKTISQMRSGSTATGEQSVGTAVSAGTAATNVESGSEGLSFTNDISESSQEETLFGSGSNHDVSNADPEEETLFTASGNADVSRGDISFAEKEISLVAGSTYQLRLTGGQDADNFTWESSDADVVTVDQSGKVRAVSDGTAEITVVSKDESMGAFCVITVTG